MGMPLRWKTSELLGSRRANAANRLLIGRLLAATAHASASRQSRSRLRQADRGHRRHATLPQSWISQRIGNSRRTGGRPSPGQHDSPRGPILNRYMRSVPAKSESINSFGNSGPSSESREAQIGKHLAGAHRTGEQPVAPTLFRRFANLGRFVAPYEECWSGVPGWMSCIATPGRRPVRFPFTSTRPHS